MLLDIHQKSRQPNTSSSFGAKLDLSYLVKLQLGESLTDKQTISFHSLDTNSVFRQKIDTETIYLVCVVKWYFSRTPDGP